jgi:hypothetical protein
VHDVSPAPENVPVGHVIHVLLDDGIYVPDGHIKHPDGLLKNPGVHGWSGTTPRLLVDVNVMGRTT